jgi:hypothetical protein
MMNRFWRFASKNVRRVGGTFVGGPALAAIVGLIVAVLAVVKQYKTYQNAQEELS